MSQQPKQGTAFSVIWAGVALASDGYNAQVLGSVLTILKKLYPTVWTAAIKSRISTAYYVGVCLGSILFGSMIDRISRKAGVIAATLLVILGVVLCTSANGVGERDTTHWIQGMFWMLAIGRGVLGVGAGGEYPISSVMATEAGNETSKLQKRRGLLVGLAGCTAIDMGIVFGNLIPLIVLAAYGYRPSTPSTETMHLESAWRVMLGLGLVIPLSVFYFRWKMATSSSFEKSKSQDPKLGWKGWWIVIKTYKYRIFGTCITWALYDAVSYPFGLFSSDIVDGLSGGKDSLITSIGWSTLVLFFYIPGCLVGALCLDWIGRKKTQTYFFAAQAVLAFIIGGAIHPIQKILPLFIVLYGLFSALGEAGPGVATILNAAECYPTAVRGHLFGLSAAVAKAGAAIGTVAFSQIQADLNGSSQGVFLVGGAFAALGAIITWFCIPEMDRDLDLEDERLRELLAQHGIVVPGSHALSASTTEQGKTAISEDGFSTDQDEKDISGEQGPTVQALPHHA